MLWGVRENKVARNELVQARCKLELFVTEVLISGDQESVKTLNLQLVIELCWWRHTNGCCDPMMR